MRRGGYSRARTGYGGSRHQGIARNIQASQEELERRTARFEQSTNSSQSSFTASRGNGPSPGRFQTLQQAVDRARENKHVAPQSIGLGRATGMFRVPDEHLSKSPELVSQLLDQLLERCKRLENVGLSALHIEERGEEKDRVSREAMEEWERIVEDYRRLTMSITASTHEGVCAMAIRVYEAAADAALLSGNLSFYLSCQSRLLKDLYEIERDAEKLGRREEFLGYSLLFYGIFCTDALEVNIAMRILSVEELRRPMIAFPLSLLTAFRNGEHARVIGLYKQCTVRQRTIIRPSYQQIQKLALAEIVRAYLSLEKRCALTRTGFVSENDFLQLLNTERPDLMPRNAQPAAEFHFRKKK